MRGSKWNSRGWTCQEAILSRRCLSFTESGVIFDCPVMRCHETLVFPMQNGRDIWQSSNFSYPPCRTHQNAFNIIRRLSEYPGRQLTYSSDHLDGFWGVLKAYERWHSPGQHHWGVPVLLPKGKRRLGIQTESCRAGLAL